MAQIDDTFSNPKDKLAYLKSIKDFILHEFEMWGYREPEKKYEWQELYQDNRVYREWMPDYLYDILNKTVRVIEKNEKTTANKKQKDQGPTSYEDSTLYTLWKKGPEHYKKVLDFLSETNATLGTPFITKPDNNNKPAWIPNNKYLGAFVRTCRVAGFIPKLTAKEYFEVIHNTFEVTAKTDDVFKPLADILRQHTDPFERWIPKNEQSH